MKKSLLTAALFAAFAAQAAVLGPDNVNTNTQGQNQGQAQGQLQGQSQGQVAKGGNAAAGAAAGAIAGASSKSSSGATAATGAVDASSANINGASANVNVEAAQPLRRVEVVSAPQVYAPPALTTANCMIGVSAGGSGMGWGFALGSGLKDESCEVRAMSQLLQSYGHVTAAKELLCTFDPRVAAAYKKAGTPCKDEVKEPKSAYSPPTTVLVPEPVLPILRPAEG